MKRLPPHFSKILSKQELLTTQTHDDASNYSSNTQNQYFLFGMETLKFKLIFYYLFNSFFIYLIPGYNNLPILNVGAMFSSTRQHINMVTVLRGCNRDEINKEDQVKSSLLQHLVRWFSTLYFYLIAKVKFTTW